MTTSGLIHVEYGNNIDGQECSGVLFEIPTTEVIGGDVIDIRIWGMDFNMLAPYALNLGTQSMGSGTNTVMPLDDIIEYPHFDENTSSITNWVISTINSIVAASTIYYDNAGVQDIWANTDDDITDRFFRNDNIITTLNNVVITGSTKINYRSSQDVQEVIEFAETHEYQAEWPIHAIGSIIAFKEIVTLNVATGAVESWAYAGEDVTDRFIRKGYSCIVSIDGLDLYGSVKMEFTRSPYYKLWQWTVPTGAQGLYWFFIYRDGTAINKFSIELPDLTEGLPEPRNIALRVVARDGGGHLDGASVYIDGLYVGITDEDGILNVDGIMTGSHDLKIIRLGFVDTDLDDLWNDKLEVY